MPTTPLYQEAIIEVKKLREIAKKEAEKSILEKFSPMVDQMINKEMQGASLIFEQDEDLTAQPGEVPPAVTMPAPDASAAAPQMPATAPMDAVVAPPAGDMGTSTMPPVDSAAPVATATEPALPLPADDATAPISDNSLSGATVGLDGKYVVDIEALFAATPEGAEPNIVAASVTPAPTATPEVPPALPAAETPPAVDAGAAALPTETTPTLAESFKESVYSLEKEILSETKEEKSLSEEKRDILQNKIFALYEMAQKARVSKDISKAIIANGEVHMELMFAKLKESAKQANSYNRQSTIEEVNMAKKEFKTLKEFAVSLFAEEVEAKGHEGFDAGHAKEEVVNANEKEGPSNHAMKASKSTPVEDPGKADSLKVGGAAVAESVVEENSVLESELMEMLGGSMEEEGASKEEEGGAPMMEAKEITEKLKALKEEQAKLMKALKECGAMGGESEPVNVNIKISVEDEGGEGVKVSGLEGSDDAGAVDGDEEFEIVPDEEGESEEGSMLGSHEEEEASEPEMEEESMSAPMVAESKVSKENKRLRSQLAETQLLTARSLFVSKIFAEHNLSTGTKQKIVEYIDSAQTVEEAKTKFGRVKKMLEESTKSTHKTVGSSSKPSASGAPVLTESVSPIMNLQMNPNRWQSLAGITKKSE